MSDEPRRSQQGMTDIAKLKARIVAMKNDANGELIRWKHLRVKELAMSYAAQMWAFDRVLRQIDDISVCDAEDTA